MKVYLAGPMRGIPHFNFPAFHYAAAELRARGYEVFSPAERDLERHGTDVSVNNFTGSEEQAAKEHGLTIRIALANDLAWIGQHAEAVAFLPGWEVSSGARAEWAVGLADLFDFRGSEWQPFPLQAVLDLWHASVVYEDFESWFSEEPKAARKAYVAICKRHKIRHGA